MFHARSLLPLLAAVCLVAPAVQAADINWQEAVARLTQEKDKAETCVRLLKRHGDPAAIERGEQAYDEAKAEYDGVIKGLTVALASRGQPGSLPDLEERLQRGFDKRQAFCKSVQPLVPPSLSGQKGILEEIVSGVAKPLIEAIVEIWKKRMDNDALTRGTIQTQLEAALWPSFDKASSSP
jgi:hypothetical protein